MNTAGNTVSETDPGPGRKMNERNRKPSPTAICSVELDLDTGDQILTVCKDGGVVGVALRARVRIT
jgi:hypothetical protein